MKKALTAQPSELAEEQDMPAPADTWPRGYGRRVMRAPTLDELDKGDDDAEHVRRPPTWPT